MTKKRKTPLKVVKPMAQPSEVDVLREQVAALGMRLTQMVVKLSERDEQIGAMRKEMALAELRFIQGASQSAVFDPATMSFVEPQKAK